MAKLNLSQVRVRKMVIFKKMGWVTVGTMLADRRRELKLTLQQVAAMADTHKGYICGIERGVLNPASPDALTLICRALKLDPNPILFKSWVEKAPFQVLPRAIDLFRMAERPALRQVQA